MSNKSEVTQMINTMEAGLNETQAAASSTRGVLSDVAGLVIPMQKDQLAILRKIAEGLPD
jgi:hypothetical protein